MSRTRSRSPCLAARGTFLRVLAVAMLCLGLPLVTPVGAAPDDAPGAKPAPGAEPAPQPAPEPAPKSIEGGPPPGSPAMPTEPAARRQWRETTWPAPTAADWAKPVLIPFQRTWEDAVAVSKETGKPILICINMDGEIASENWAGIRYRSPEIADLFKNYVCVIASVYRHNPRDYDDQGHRILCPRFGSVTCGEHIAMEPTIYKKYCDGKRIAPRHIAVDLQKNEVFDVYYANDTASIVQAIRKGLEGLPAPKPPIVRGDRPIVDRVASRALEDRKAVEAAYLSGDADTKRALLEAAMKHLDADPLDLLRLAIFGLDVDQSRLAREALAKTDSPRATVLISKSLEVPMAPSERDALIGALKRLGEHSPLARWLAGVHAGLTAQSTVDVKGWSDALSGGTYPAPTPDVDAVAWKTEEMTRAADKHPDEPGPRLELAEASLKLAGESEKVFPENPALARRMARAAYEDARKAALEAEKLGASGWRVDSAVSLADYYLDDLDKAYARAEKAMKELPPGDGTWQSMALVTVFAESRWKGIKAAVHAKKPWPPEWLADLDAAYAVLRKHPMGTDSQVLWHYDFLVWLGADHRADQVLREGLDRFIDSVPLHQRFRSRLLAREGAEKMQDAYDELLKQHGPSGSLCSFAGLGSVAAAEDYRRHRKWDEALKAYDRAVGHYEDAVKTEPSYKTSVDRAVSLALAGKARVLFEVGKDEEATKVSLAGIARDPAATGTQDGMGQTPGETAQAILTRLRLTDKNDLADKIAKVFDTLDPDLLPSERD